MGVVVGVLKETAASETRVALIPEIATKLKGMGALVRIERGAGVAAHFADQAYADAEICDAATILSSADVLLCVQPPAIEVVERPQGGRGGGRLHAGLRAARSRARTQEPAHHELRHGAGAAHLPRTGDGRPVLAGPVAGYKAALIAANTPQIPAHADHRRRHHPSGQGAGGRRGCRRPAGHRDGEAPRRDGGGYDVRSAAQEQVESLGAKFVDTGVSAEGAGGYARELTPKRSRNSRRRSMRDRGERCGRSPRPPSPGAPRPRSSARPWWSHEAGQP